MGYIKKTHLNNERIIKKVVRGIARKNNVSVRVSRSKNTSWYTDVEKRIVYYPKSIYNINALDAISLLLHEIGHIVHTTTPKKAEMEKVKDTFELHVIKDLTNAFCDIRIDNLMINEYENGALLIQNLHDIGMIHGYKGLCDTVNHRMNEKATKEKTIKSLKENRKNRKRLTECDNDYERIRRIITGRIKNHPHYRNISVHETIDTCINEVNNITKSVSRVIKRDKDRIKDHTARENSYYIHEIGLITLLKYYGGFHEHSPIAQYYKYDKKTLTDPVGFYNDTRIDVITDLIVGAIHQHGVISMKSTNDVFIFTRDVVMPIIRKHLYKDDNHENTHGGCGCGNDAFNKDGSQWDKTWRKIKKNNHMDNITGDIKDITKEKEKHRAKIVKDHTGKDATSFGKPPPHLSDAYRKLVDIEHHKRKNKYLLNKNARYIDRMFKENAYLRHGGKFRSGLLNIRKLYKTRLHDTRVFTRKVDVKGKNCAVSMIVDVSGSMMYERAYRSMRAMVLMGSLFEMHDIPYQITMLSTRFHHVKAFDDATMNRKKIMALGGSLLDGGTQIKDAHEENINALQYHGDKNTTRLLIFFTDGDFDYSEREYIRDNIRQNRDVAQYGVSIGDNSASTISVFGERNTIIAPEPKDVMGALAGIIRKNIKL